MDPQQRLFLEVAWDALEHAAIAPHAIEGTRTGVFAGVCTSDFATLYGSELKLVDGDYGTGSSPSIVANRLSYLLDLKGPSETIDTACSSSLAALHHACQALEHLDCDAAIVGGVNAVLAPEVSVSFSQIGALARDGRCKAFDASADGFVRSEGAGVVVLKRLSDAVRDGDRVYALLAGSAVNHDGRSNGLSAPSGPAQRDVVELALARAQITHAELDYVEAHGVGTAVADAVELHALGGVLADGPRERALIVGSAKTNVGHLEAASGMVSVIKVALALDREHIPKQLHCEQPIASLATLPIRIAVAEQPWPRGARSRYAGVSAFGFGGSNAHIVLREGPLPKPRAPNDARTPRAVALSARTPSALLARVRALSEHLERDPTAVLDDVSFTLSAGRAHMSERLVIITSSLDELRETLLSVALGALPRNTLRGSVRPAARPRLAILFAEGPIDPDLGPRMLAAFPQLETAFASCERASRGVLEVPLRDALWSGSRSQRGALLARPAMACAATFALHHALWQLTRELGLDPAVIAGAGAGEYAAAAACECLPWDQALVLAIRRAVVIEGLNAGAAQQLTLRDARATLGALDAQLKAPRLPLISAFHGRLLASDARPDAAFWSRHLLASADATPATAELAEHADIVLDVSGSSVLPGVQRVTLLGEDDAPDGPWLALASLFVRGLQLKLDAGARGGGKVALPGYPFERTRHWLDFPERDRGVRRQSTAAPVDTMVERRISHPFIGRVRSSRPATAGSGFMRKVEDDKAEGS